VEGNVTAFNNSTRNVRGELVARALSARYMLAKVPGLPSGTVTTFLTPTQPSNPYSITAGPDGNVWFPEWGGNKIGRITPAGVITEFPMAVASGAQGIVTGPDGNLWIAERGSSKIARVTTAGAITEFPVPLANVPFEITAGVDGNLWFASPNSHSGSRYVP
jgi:streptogramin lyase